ncbi:unnamed protein product, partial [Prorocentrum cordatum]
QGGRPELPRPRLAVRAGPRPQDPRQGHPPAPEPPGGAAPPVGVGARPEPAVAAPGRRRASGPAAVARGGPRRALAPSPATVPPPVRQEGAEQLGAAGSPPGRSAAAREPAAPARLEAAPA